MTAHGKDPAGQGAERRRPWWQWALLIPVMVIGFAIAGDASDLEPRAIARAPLAVRILFRIAATMLLVALLIAGIIIYLAATA